MSARLSIPRDCPHCDTHGSVSRPSGAWMVALVAGYVLLFAMGIGMGLLGIAGPFMVLPAIGLYALGTLPFLHTRASEPATCGACGKIVVAVASEHAALHRVEPELKTSMPLRRSA